MVLIKSSKFVIELTPDELLKETSVVFTKYIGIQLERGICNKVGVNLNSKSSFHRKLYQTIKSHHYKVHITSTSICKKT